jgi:ferric-dicitrate binding protein FerR (iron transport regulator)
MEAVLPAACERARAWSSLAVDCELSELERAHLRSHLAECEACTAFLVGAREIAQELRTAPLPAPSRPLAPPPRRRVPLVLAVVAIVVAAALGGLAGSMRSPAPKPAVTASSPTQLALRFRPTTQTRPGTRLPQQTAA